jgi:hypothetical protein
MPQAPQFDAVVSGVSHPSTSGAIGLQSAKPGEQPVYAQVTPPPSAGSQLAPRLFVVSHSLPHPPQLAVDVSDDSQPFVSLSDVASSQSTQPAWQPV